ncbi:MAG: carboxypeptidase-like regulatory domain-containing protein [Terracidiphilus sp.]|jgi:hypothetical protein
MKTTQFLLRTVTLSLFFTGALAQAVTVTGTVTNKTSNRPAAGDAVVLVDVQAGMHEVARATTDAAGHYTLNEPGSGPYLVRVTHQGAGYFIGAPQGSAPGDITVYDVAAKVEGISVEQEILEIEATNGQLDVIDHYLVHNTSSPRKTQFSANTFEFVLPAEAVLDGAAATRPSGLPTTALPQPLAQKGHFTFNVPIEPEQGDNLTMFEVHYHLPYNGKYTFSPKVPLPTDFFAVELPKGMTFASGSGAAFQPVPQNPAIQTMLVRNALPGKPLEFTVSGTGSMPREEQGAQAGQQPGAGAGQDSSAPGNQPGGGIGNPIGTPDPLSKYKWWILGGLALLLAAAAAFLLRKPATTGAVASAAEAGAQAASIAHAGTQAYQPVGTAASKNTALLNTLKEELFALESEKVSGTLAPEEYAEVKAALEIVLKRALKRS